MDEQNFDSLESTVGNFFFAKKDQKVNYLVLNALCISNLETVILSFKSFLAEQNHCPQSQFPLPEMELSKKEVLIQSLATGPEVYQPDHDSDVQQVERNWEYYFRVRYKLIMRIVNRVVEICILDTCPGQVNMKNLLARTPNQLAHRCLI